MTRTSIGGMSTPKNRREGKGHLPFYRDEAFWSGFASAFELFGRGNRLAKQGDPWKADYEALKMDHEAIGADFRKSLLWFDDKYADQLKKVDQQRLFDPDKQLKP